MRRAWVVSGGALVWLCLMAPAAALAEEAAGGAQDSEEQGQITGAPKAQVFEEVERGFFLRTTLGAAMAVTDMFGDSAGVKRESTLWPGPVVGLEIGYDFGQYASLHLAAQGQQIIGVQERNDRESGADATLLALMLGGRVNLVTSQRVAWYLKVGAGWMFTWPELAGLDSGFLVHGGTGVEYATKLRHFTVGLEATAQYDIANGGLLVGLSPTLKYVF
ncbi:MAG TPA: adventurous gliding motility protein CglE [Myxococcota bacterium]|nr:adventurous gliding motility protein CglE [Myxococcota bacterium]HRY96279.1 adventurous gliding motility protein CglE [Myxococcota bacterium]